MTAFHTHSPTYLHSPTSDDPTPTSIPEQVYRVHRTSSQTRYSFSTGFLSKNQTTILNHTQNLSRFGLAHLHSQTNISSPFISVYDNLAHAEAVARYWGDKFKQDTMVVTVDTKHLARGPVFRAADLLRESGGDVKCKSREGECGEWLHRGEYLVMYRIPPQAIRVETLIVRSGDHRWRAVGVIGGA